jgi:hypothetical protein
MKKIKKIIHYSLVALFSPIYLGLAFTVAILIRAISGCHNISPRLVWGPIPIINNVYWSKAMKNAGYSSTTFTIGFYSTINKREDWDLLL